jgi:hypothetical protein
MKILSADEIAEQSPEDCLELFNKLGEKAFGTYRFGRIFAAKTATGESTVGNWRGGISPIPVWAVLILYEWSREKTNDVILMQAIETVSTDLSKTATNLRAAANLVRQNLNAAAVRRDDGV